jgi:metal-responsive CopG/Arc/MetJ family transcriptional regulator
MRTHVVLPDDLVKEVDALVGKRRRSAFIAEAAQDRLRRERLARVLEETAGAFKAEDHPEWATSKNVAAWVRKQRRQRSRRVAPPYG